MIKKLFFYIFLMFIFSQNLNAQKSTVSDDNFREPYKICFNNNTSKTVYVAVRYKNLSNKWVTKYWYKFRSYEKDKKTNKYTFKTYNRYFYYYAREKSKSNGSFSYWGGSDNYKRIEGKSVGMKEVYLSRSKFEKPRGQKYYINLNY